MSYQIAVVDVRNIKGVKEIRITPDADAELLFLAGDNEAGKTSVLDAILEALGGKGAGSKVPLRRGEESGEITVELKGDDGERYEVTRKITETNSTLEIRGPGGVIRSPQAWLNRIAAGRFIDPTEFLAGKTPEDDRRRRKALLQVAGIDVSDIEASRAQLTQERTVTGREYDRAKALYESIPIPATPPPPTRAIRAITDDLVTVDGDLRTITQVRVDLVNKRRDQANVDHALADLRAEHLRLAARLQRAEADAVFAAQATAAATAKADEVATPEREAELAARREALRSEQARAESAARWQANAAADDRRRSHAEADVTVLSGKYDSLTDKIAELDQRKIDRLASAPMPIEGLSVTDDGILYKGIPFSDASGAIRLSTALAVAMHNQEVRDVLCRDASLIDDKNLATIRSMARGRGFHVWLERVGRRDPGAIEIVEGRLASDPAA
jgi:hypothetical protein